MTDIQFWLILGALAAIFSALATIAKKVFEISETVDRIDNGK